MLLPVQQHQKATTTSYGKGDRPHGPTLGDSVMKGVRIRRLPLPPNLPPFCLSHAPTAAVFHLPLSVFLPISNCSAPYISFSSLPLIYLEHIPAFTFPPFQYFWHVAFSRSTLLLSYTALHLLIRAMLSNCWLLR